MAPRPHYYEDARELESLRFEDRYYARLDAQDAADDALQAVLDELPEPAVPRDPEWSRFVRPTFGPESDGRAW